MWYGLLGLHLVKKCYSCSWTAESPCVQYRLEGFKRYLDSKRHALLPHFLIFQQSVLFLYDKQLMITGESLYTKSKIKRKKKWTYNEKKKKNCRAQGLLIYFKQDGNLSIAFKQVCSSKYQYQLDFVTGQVPWNRKLPTLWIFCSN